LKLGQAAAINHTRLTVTQFAFAFKTIIMLRQLLFVKTLLRKQWGKGGEKLKQFSLI